MENPIVTDVAAVWGAPLEAIHCAHCGEAHLSPSDELPDRCPYCLKGPVASQPAYLRDEAPEQILPYAVDGQKLGAIFERWTKGVWFRPNGLQADTLARRARRYFIPLWLVDARVEGGWQADVGFDYEAVTYQDQYRDGRGWQSHKARERRVRWEPRAGQIRRNYENLDAPALDDHRQLMQRLGDFDLARRLPYHPEQIARGAVRIPTLEPAEAWPGVEGAFERAAASDCRQASGGDHIRSFKLAATYEDLNWTLLLLPAYVTWYRAGDQVWPVLVNGQNGHVDGVRRADTRKANVTSLVLGGIAAALFVLGALITLIGLPFPLLAVFGGLTLVLGVILGLVAPIPAIGVWVFNRRSAAGNGR